MFKVGDRVRSDRFGDGKVINLEPQVGVVFDRMEVEYLHSMGGRCEKNHGRYYQQSGRDSEGFDSITLIPSIKVGDTVRLIDKYYEHEDFKKLDRDLRKEIGKARGKDFVAFEIKRLPLGLVVDSYCTSGSLYDIPLSMLERVEPKAKEEPSIADRFASIPERLVKRHAKVGEKIRIVAEDASHDLYKNGDTRTVSYIGSGAVRVQEHNWWICDEEYLVIESGKHVYTDEQKAEALRIATEILNENYKQNPIPNKEIVVKLWGGKIGKSKCAPTDEYAYEIGLMVACCHATGRNLPNWIK